MGRAPGTTPTRRRATTAGTACRASHGTRSAGVQLAAASPHSGQRIGSARAAWPRACWRPVPAARRHGSPARLSFPPVISACLFGFTARPPSGRPNWRSRRPAVVRGAMRASVPRAGFLRDLDVCLNRQVRQDDSRWQWAHVGDPLRERARELVTERGWVTGGQTDPRWPSGPSPTRRARLRLTWDISDPAGMRWRNERPAGGGP